MSHQEQRSRGLRVEIDRKVFKESLIIVSYSSLSQGCSGYSTQRKQVGGRQNGIIKTM